MTQIMLYHLGMWVQIHMSQLANGPMPMAGELLYEKLFNDEDIAREGDWLHRNRVLASLCQIKLVNGGRTLILESKSKHREFNRKQGTYFFKWHAVETVGISVKPDGVVRCWAKHGGHYRSLGWDELNRLMGVVSRPIAGERYQAVIDAFVKFNGAETLQELVMPWTVKFNWNPVSLGMPWVMRVMQARDINEFWSRLCPKNKLAKDEKRALWAAMEARPQNMIIARLCGLVHIPNLRSITMNEGINHDVTARLYTRSTDIKAMAKDLRRIPPQRRAMFIQAMIQGGRQEGMATDAMRMVRMYQDQGILPENLNLRSVDEYHEACMREQRREQERRAEERRVWQEERAAQRAAQDAQWRLDNAELYAQQEERRLAREAEMAAAWEKTKEAQEKAFLLHGEVIGDSGIEVVMPQSTEEPRLWGNEQNHCIGSYAHEMAAGRVILMGFRRGDKWVGHASIKSGYIAMLLGHSNRSLAPEDLDVITTYLVEKEVVDTTHVDWA